MSASSYGIIVEGAYDSVVYEAFIRRLTSPDIHIKPLLCEGKTNLMKNFPGLLRRFEYEIGGNPVDMAIVIRDADGKNTRELEAKMRTKIQGRNYPFRLDVRFFAVPQAMDAWLLADPGAISAAVEGRDGKSVTKSHDDPEGLLDPKEWLRKLLTDHKATYTTELCREIAQKTDLQTTLTEMPQLSRLRGTSRLLKRSPARVSYVRGSKKLKIGVLISMEPPTKPMLKEAAEAGFYKPSGSPKNILVFKS